MMRLRKTLNRKDEETGKTWDKWRIDVSTDEARVLEDLGWGDGDELTLERQGDHVKLTRKRKR